MDVRGDSRGCSVHLFCLDTVDEGPPVSLLESHWFSDGIRTHMEVNFIEADNSLEARLERMRQGSRIEADAIEWVEDPADAADYDAAENNVISAWFNTYGWT